VYQSGENSIFFTRAALLGSGEIILLSTTFGISRGGNPKWRLTGSAPTQRVLSAIRPTPDTRGYSATRSLV